MASSLDGRVTVFEDNSYAIDISTLVNHTILDADVYGFTYPGGVLKQWNGTAWVDAPTTYTLYKWDGTAWQTVG